MRQNESGIGLSSWLGVTVLFAVLGSACVPDSERATQHWEQAEEFLLENKRREAMLAFHRAARLQPDNADLSLRAAEAATELGFYSDAADFYREALLTRPDDPKIPFRLAKVLLKFDPDGARQVADELLAADSKDARAWIILAELAILENEMETAKAHIAQARRLSPQEPEVDWTLAYAEEEVGRIARFRNPLAKVSPRHWRGILSAYDRYLANGGERQLGAATRRAHALSMISDRQQEAQEAHRQLLDRLDTSERRSEKVGVLSAVTRYALSIRDLELAQEAVTLWTELTPEDPLPWSHQATVYSHYPPEERQAAYEKTLETAGANPTVHAAYADYLTETKGLKSGLDYLTEQLSENSNEASLLVAIIDLQQRNGRVAAAAKSLADLERSAPNERRLPVMAARQAVFEEDYGRAEAILEEVPAASRTAPMYQTLAYIQTRQRLHAEALKTIHTAIALSTEPDPTSLRLEAQIYGELGQHRKVASTLARVAKLSPLTPEEQSLLGGSYYDARSPGIGRKLMQLMLAHDPANSEVALELYRRDGTNPQHSHSLREYLERALELNPDNTEVLTAVTQLDLSTRQFNRALVRVEKTINRANWVGYPYLIRSQIHLSTARLRLAVQDAKRARLLDRELLEESYEAQARAHLASGDPSVPIKHMEAAAQKGELSADDLALLARLKLHSGDPQGALEFYERALEAGTRLNHVKNDLATLLVESQGDLERAEALALAAVEAPGEQLNAIDTLGYVYLKQGNPEAAYWKFRYAIANTKTPNPEYHYHLALALLALEREAEAREALAVTLGLDPDFKPARDLHATLGSGLPEKDAPEAETS